MANGLAERLQAAGNALIGAARAPLRIGVPLPFSIHSELLIYWLSPLGLPAPQNVDIWTVPPSLMAEAHPGPRNQLIRAVAKSSRWLSEAASHRVTAEVLGRPDYLNPPGKLSDRALTGRLVISPQGDQRNVASPVEFHRGAASFPWQSQAEWIGL